MKRNKKLLLSLAALSASIMTYAKVEDKIKAEVTFGIDTHFGADGAEKASRMALPAMDLIFAKKVQDYDKKKEPKNQSIEKQVEKKTIDYYVPKYPENRDLELAIRYISKEYKFRKRLGIKLSEDYFGLRLGLDVIGKDNDYENFIEKNEIDKLRLTLTSENKYLNGTLKYYVIGEEKKKYGIDKIEEEKEKIGNKEVDYNVTFNPLADYPIQAFVNVRGQGKRAEINPSLGGSYKGFYFNAGPVFATNREKLDINEEIENISYAAPGYDKIEYFKKWKKKERVDLSTKEKYDADHADLEKAEVSGYKGTYRLLGYYSGSLFGDSPVKLAVNTFLDEIHKNSETKKISKLLEELENGITLSGHLIWDGIALLKNKSIIQDAVTEGTSLYTSKKEVLNGILTTVTSKLLDRAGIGYGRKTSHLGLIKQVPNDFKQLFPGLTSNFDFFEINPGILDPTYLYFNGFTYNDPNIPGTLINKPKTLGLANERSKTEMPQALTVSNKDYELTNRWHYLGEDLFNYSLPDFDKYYRLSKLKKEFPNSSPGASEILGYIFRASKRILVADAVTKISNILKNPYEMRGIDLTRAMYFHASEKEKNIFKVEETLAKIKTELDEIKELKQTNNISAKLNAGYVGNGYRIDLHSRINDRTDIKSSDDKKLDFTKIQHTAGINVQGMYKGFIAQTSLDTTYTDVSLKYTKNGKDNNAKETVLKYKDINLVSQTYLGYRIKVGSKWDIDLGLSHYGEYGYIMPETFKVNGEDYKLNVVKRDKDGKPIDLEGKSVDISTMTEKKLVDKAFEKKSQINDKKDEKSKRKFNADDALQKEKKPLENSWRSIYNILSPKIGVTYRPYKSFEVRNEFQLPVAFNKSEFSGVNIMYKTEFKYLLGSSDFDIFTDMNKAFNLRTKGKVDAGVELVERNGVYANYDIFADLSAAKVSLYGKDLDPNIDLSINPLVVNLPLKPRVIISKENKDIYLKYGTELELNKETSIVAGVQKQINKDKQIFKNDLQSTIKEVLVHRNKKDEITAFDNKLKDFKFENNLNYTLTPFVNVDKISDNLTIRTGFSSKSGEAVVKTTSITDSEYRIKDEDLKALGDYKNSNSYITYAQDKNRSFWQILGDAWVYFVPLKKYSDHREINKTEILFDKKYKVYLNLDYDNEIGFNVRTNVDLEYNNVKYTSKAFEKHIEKIKQNVYALQIRASNKYIDPQVKEQFVDQNIVSFGSSDNKQNKYDKIKKIIEERNGKDFDNSYKDQIIKKVEEKVEDKVIPEKPVRNNLQYKSININSDIHLGYNFKVIDEFFIGVGINHKLELKYVMVDNVLLDDLKLFGSNMLKAKNILSPEVSAKYNIIKGISWTSSINVPVSFENAKYKRTNVNIKTGFEFKW
ncbi:hypothetical protein [Caviibacter abscessus]|uniref:hypothetical protein n=1 Tax=Caviibacter abscessus TaxID=1766719 RepID=UPI00082AF9DE|nr:hypothetical protein [Caviibacter abscessus]